MAAPVSGALLWKGDCAQTPRKVQRSRNLRPNPTTKQWPDPDKSPDLCGAYLSVGKVHPDLPSCKRCVKVGWRGGGFGRTSTPSSGNMVQPLEGPREEGGEGWGLRVLT